VNQLISQAIVLSRTEFGEADRIITLLTPGFGKVRLMAKGVRRMKSKLAGGIELFSVSDITFIKGKGEIGTLVSSRLRTYYRNIVQDIDRVQLGYELIKSLHKATEDAPEVEYFDLLEQSFVGLDDETIPLDLLHVWFQAQLLQLAGYMPNLLRDNRDEKLDSQHVYNFDIDSMSFYAHQDGIYNADHIKTLRLLFGRHRPGTLAKIQGVNGLLVNLKPLLQMLTNSYIVRKY
jgi:DNA repair protein RecO